MIEERIIYQCQTCQNENLIKNSHFNSRKNRIFVGSVNMKAALIRKEDTEKRKKNRD